MAGTLRRRHGSRHALLFTTVLPITPLVDISLMLVVFFLLTSLTGAGAHAVPVVLPKAGTASKAAATTVDLAIDRDGRMTIGGQQVTLAELRGRVTSTSIVMIHADAQVAHGRVIAAVDAVRQTGVERIFYATVKATVEEW
jgi:biopolymer transport protein ExbD